MYSDVTGTCVVNCDTTSTSGFGDGTSGFDAGTSAFGDSTSGFDTGTSGIMWSSYGFTWFSDGLDINSYGFLSEARSGAAATFVVS